MIPVFTKNFDLAVVSSPGTYWSCLDKFGKEVKRFEIPMKRHVSPLNDLVSLVKLIKLFHKEKPFMVHSMTPKAGLLCMTAAKITGVPYRLHTFTGLVFPIAKGLKKTILKTTDRITCACASHIIPEGEGVKRDLLDNGITNKPIRVLGNGSCQGIDLQHFDRTPEVMEEAEKMRDPRFTFVSIGRIVGDKGISELVKAFARLNKEYPDTVLRLVGGYEPKLDPLPKEVIHEVDYNDAIHAVGIQRDVRPWLASADCAILASYREGFPNVVLEAGAMGLPQIVTDINGANEIIQEGVNGTIVPSKDADALYEAMKKMILDAELRKGMATNARKFISDRYKDSYVQECLYEFYSEITGKTLER